MITGTELATMTELSVLAGVSKQAVWNWSKRKADFPPSVSEGPNGPLYRVSEFLQWLEAKGKLLNAAFTGRGSVFEEVVTADPSKALQSIEAMSAVNRKRLREELSAKMEMLQALEAGLDPVKQPEHVFDPSNPNYMGRFTAAALLIQPRHPISEVHKFYGSGVYAIYYKGSFEAYEAISGSETPVYSGKADPKVAHAANPSEQGESLSNRINEHRKSIEAVSGAGGIAVDDFEIRYLVTASGFQVTAETFLINYFKPIWNKETKICFGIGKHGDDANTRRNKKSPWDTLHPGRKWAIASEEIRTKEQICQDIAEHLKTHPPLMNVDFNLLLSGF